MSNQHTCFRTILLHNLGATIRLKDTKSFSNPVKSRAARAAQSIMALIGRYETYEQLSEGSTGTVYRGRDIVLAREVALTILDGNTRLSSRLLDNFSAGEQMPSEWLHPNIAIVYGIGVSQAGTFVASELVTGADVRSHIRNRCALTLPQKLDLIAQACEGLAHAHRNGLTHCSITPESFFIDEKQQLKIVDLGIRRVGTAAPLATEKSGTFDYLAPEQLWTGSCDARSDIFSAAIVFYEFLVNAHPFRSAFVPRRIVGDTPDILLEHDSRLPGVLQDVLFKALSKAPEDRFQSAGELAQFFRGIESEVRAAAAPGTSAKQSVRYRPVASQAEPIPSQVDLRSLLNVLSRFDEHIVNGRTLEAHEVLGRVKSLCASAPGKELFDGAIQDCEERLEAAGEPVFQGAGSSTSLQNGRFHETQDHVASRDPVSAEPQSKYPLTSPAQEKPFKRSSFPSLGVTFLGTVAVGIFLLSAAFFVNESRAVRSPAILAQAEVNVPETDLVDTPNSNSRVLAELRMGYEVNILDRIPSTNDLFTHAQVTIGKTKPLEGYVRKVDLGQWRSDNAAAAWEIVSTSSPVDTATPEEIRQYVAKLADFINRFPTSPQVPAARAANGHWQSVLQPNFNQPIGTPNQAVAQTSLPQIPSQADSKVNRLLDQMPALWEDGQLERVVELTERAMVSDPDNPQLKLWHTRARKALRKLNDQ